MVSPSSQPVGKHSLSILRFWRHAQEFGRDCEDPGEGICRRVVASWVAVHIPCGYLLLIARTPAIRSRHGAFKPEYYHRALSPR